MQRTAELYDLILFPMHRLDTEGDKANGCTTNAVHPGLVLTEVTRNFNPIIQALYALAKPIMRTLQKSPRCVVYGVIAH